VDVGAVVDWLRSQFKYDRDAKSSLAVLHNQNDMVTHFKASSWVSEAQGAVVFRGVTTCAGMTAHTVIVAQTKIGFLTGGRRASFHDLPQEEQDIQLEEAYGRATVALTRARSLCVILGPLDMKGLLGAATVIGSLMYGAGHVFKGQANFYMHGGSFRNSPSDEDFGHLLEKNNSLTSPHLPPLAIAEALQDNVAHWYKIRRLHLIVVDTWSPWQYNTAQVRAVTDLMKHLAHTPEMQRMVPLMPQGGRVPPRCRRFVYGYALDHSEFPCYLLWPCRVQGEYWLVGTMAQGSLKLSTETYFRPLGLHHFYEAFSIEGKADLRTDALAQFGLLEAELTSDLRLTAPAVLRMQWGQHREQPNAPPAHTARRDRVPPGVISPEQGEEEQGLEEEETNATGTDSANSSEEQDGLSPDATRTPLLEDSHQHGLMLAAYREVGHDYAVKNSQLVKGCEVLKRFESVPRRWPLARLTIPLLRSVEYLDRVLAGCCWEVLITRKDPNDSLGVLRQAANSITLTFVSYLAEFVAETLRACRTPQGGPLTDEENIHLLGANFWVQPIYQELLHAASGHNVSVDGERKRPCSGLVKIVAKPRRPNKKTPDVDTACVSDWLGGYCPADSLMVWFPAHCPASNSRTRK